MWDFFMVLDALKKGRAFETSETTHLVTRRHNQKELNLQQHRCDNLNFISPWLFSKCHVFKGDNVFKYTGFVFRSRDILQHIHFLLSLSLCAADFMELMTALCNRHYRVRTIIRFVRG